ncbi:MAG: GNAT family N-acetyltransferase [Clostridia bacterium]|nr:GNAT family N-acetyltransferase [Clostridia bacterium]
MKRKCEITIKTGETLLLRSLCAQDAQQALQVCRRTAGETLNLMRYEDEWNITAEQEAEFIRRAENGPKSLMLGAFFNGRLIGIGSIAPPSPVDRARHRADLGICVLKSHWGMGVGTAMMRALIDAAKETALEQLELQVVSANETAIRLYERFGFETFARHPRKLKYRDGRYADMLLMMLDLRNES